MATSSPSPSARGEVTTSSGISGSCSLRLIVGGAVRSCSARTVKIASIAPAPPSRWPVEAFVAVTVMSSRWSPKITKQACQGCWA